MLPYTTNSSHDFEEYIAVLYRRTVRKDKDCVNIYENNNKG